MSDGFERPTTLAAAPLELLDSEAMALPLAVLPCAVLNRAGRFPSLPEGS
jgi:hypothetical protein